MAHVFPSFTLIFRQNVQIRLNIMLVHETGATGLGLPKSLFSFVIALFLPPSVNYTLVRIIRIRAIGPVGLVEIII